MDASSFCEMIRFRYFFDQSNYPVDPDGTVAVTVYLRETFNPCTGSSLLAPGSDGLVSAGVQILISSPTAARPATVRTPSAIVGNPVFDFAIIPQLPLPKAEKSAGIIALSSHPAFGEIGSRTPTCATVLLALATFTFTAGPIPGEVTYLTARNTETNLCAPANNFVTASGLVLDHLLEPDTATITVTSPATATGPNWNARQSNRALDDTARLWRRGRE